MPSEATPLSALGWYAILVVVIPALTAVGIFLAARRAPNGLAGTAIAAVFLLAWVFDRGSFEFPGIERWHHIAAAMLIAGMISPWLGVLEDRVTDVVSAFGLSVLAGLAAAQWIHFPAWTPWHDWALGGSIALVAFAGEWISIARPGGLVPLCLGIAISAEAALLGMSGFLGLAVPAGAVALALIGGSHILQLRLIAHDGSEVTDSPVRTFAGGGALTAGLLLVLIAFAGDSYNYTPIARWMWFAPAAAPMLLVIGEIPRLKRIEGVRGACMRVIPILGACVITVVMGWKLVAAV
ncbi:MAG: hypothetical protein O2800_06560 [Planctomycetota bacterium]|nr:hypothetical protein [Planctomycetota bacterium]